MLCYVNSAIIMYYVNRNLNTDAHQLVGIGKRVGSRTLSGFTPRLEDVVTHLASSVSF